MSLALLERPRLKWTDDRLLARIEQLEAELRAERSARRASDKNAARFHALLLRERVLNIRRMKSTGDS